MPLARDEAREPVKADERKRRETVSEPRSLTGRQSGEAAKQNNGSSIALVPDRHALASWRGLLEEWVPSFC
jgi:hypothetical protein